MQCIDSFYCIKTRNIYVYIMTSPRAKEYFLPTYISTFDDSMSWDHFRDVGNIHQILFWVFVNRTKSVQLLAKISTYSERAFEKAISFGTSCMLIKPAQWDWNYIHIIGMRFHLNEHSYQYSIWRGRSCWLTWFSSRFRSITDINSITMSWLSECCTNWSDRDQNSCQLLMH